MRPIVVADARPNFVKVAPLLRAMRAHSQSLWDGQTAGRVAAILAAGTPTVEWVSPVVHPLLAARVSSTVPTTR